MVLVSGINSLLVCVSTGDVHRPKKPNNASFILSKTRCCDDDEPKGVVRFENDPCRWRNNDISCEHLEPSGLRVCDKGKMEAACDQYFSLYEAIGIKYPSFCSHKERANISIKTQSASLHTQTQRLPASYPVGLNFSFFHF